MKPASSFPHSAFRIRHSRPRALTLVELLIVIVVIGILVSAILVGGSGLIHSARDNNTAAVLQVVTQAVEEFKREQTAKPTLCSAAQQRQGAPPGTMVKYLDRYDRYPPDELELFTARGLPGAAPTSARTLGPGGATIHTPSSAAVESWGAMRGYGIGDDTDAVEHRDMLAMVTAIETMSESGAAILDRLPDKNRGTSVLFLDRPGGTANVLDAGDLELRPILDDWGIPICYLAQRDHTGTASDIASRNHAGWNEASTEMIRLNGGVPLIFSYGANGKEQLTRDAMEPNAKASLVGDFEDDSRPEAHHKVDNPFNDDNVYANPNLREKLAKGLQTP